MPLYTTTPLPTHTGEAKSYDFPTRTSILSYERDMEKAREDHQTIKDKIDPAHDFTVADVDFYTSKVEFLSDVQKKDVFSIFYDDIEIEEEGKDDREIYAYVVKDDGILFQDNLSLFVGKDNSIKTIMKGLIPVVHAIRHFYEKGYIHNNVYLNTISVKSAEEENGRILSAKLVDYSFMRRVKSLKDVRTFLDNFFRICVPLFPNTTVDLKPLKELRERIPMKIDNNDVPERMEEFVRIWKDTASDAEEI